MKACHVILYHDEDGDSLNQFEEPSQCNR